MEFSRWNFPGGLFLVEFSRWNFPRWNFPRWNLPTTRRNTMKTPVPKFFGSGNFSLVSGLNYSACPQNLRETSHFFTLAAPLIWACRGYFILFSYSSSPFFPIFFIFFPLFFRKKKGALRAPQRSGPL